MHYESSWNLDSTSVLTRQEFTQVLQNLKVQNSANGQRNLVIFRLACCCGLRVSEIATLQMRDVVLDGARPHLRLRKEATKGKRARNVPLWWDRGTLEDLSAWKALRERDGDHERGAFVCSVQSHRFGQPLKRHALRRRFLTACKVLGLARLKSLTIHHGRHTYISHALAGGRTLAEVKNAAGHRNVATTSVYLHLLIDDDEKIGNLFGVS